MEPDDIPYLTSAAEMSVSAVPTVTIPSGEQTLEGFGESFDLAVYRKSLFG